MYQQYEIAVINDLPNNVIQGDNEHGPDEVRLGKIHVYLSTPVL